MIAAAFVATGPSAAAHSPHDDIWDIAVSPAYAEDQTIFVVSRGRLQRSSDGGETWQEIVRDFGNARLARLSVSHAAGEGDDGTMYVTSRTAGVFRSTDGGDSWESSNAGLDDLDLDHVAASPTVEDLVLVAGRTGGLYRSTDAGRTWTDVGEIARATSITFAEDGTGRVIVGAADGHIWLSEDEGENWDSVASPGTGAVTALATGGDGSSASTVVAATARGDVLRSTDGGSSFEAVGRAPSGEPTGIAVAADDGSVVWLSTGDGAYRSTDGGTSWEAQRAGLTESEQADEIGAPHFRVIRAAEGSGGAELLLGGFDGLFRFDADAGRWRPIETAADYVSGLAVSPDFADDRTVVVMTYVKGGFLSEDAGETWQMMNDGLRFEGLSEGNRLLPLRRGHGVVFSPDYASDRTIFSATWPRLIRSVDGGETWSAIDIEEPDGDWSPLRQYVLAVSPDFATDRTIFAGNRHGMIFRSEGAGDAGTWSKLATVDGRVRSFAISPAYPADRTVFVGSVGGVFRSEDGGETWQHADEIGRSPRSTGGELDPAPLLAISPDFESDGTVFAGTDRGLFVTRDRGDSWTRVTSEAISESSEVLAVGVSPDFRQDGTVLVSVAGEGLYRSTDGGGTFERVGHDLSESNRMIADYDNPTSSPIQFSSSFASDRTVFAYAGPDVVRSTDGGETWDVLELPTVAEVAASLGVEVDALSLQEGQRRRSETAGRPEDDDRRTFDTPLGVLSVRRLAAAGVAAGAVVVLMMLLHVGSSWSRERRWGARLIVAVAVFVAAAAVLAA